MVQPAKTYAKDRFAKQFGLQQEFGRMASAIRMHLLLLSVGRMIVVMKIGPHHTFWRITTVLWSKTKRSILSTAQHEEMNEFLPTKAQRSQVYQPNRQMGVVFYVDDAFLGYAFVMSKVGESTSTRQRLYMKFVFMKG
ncbi:hypothetical protein Ae201684P_019539 [Aphanomyces euteiches]|nr:hypothetical protein Ae201684P_019539 [Aphanomyces euteiches]